MNQLRHQLGTNHISRAIPMHMPCAHAVSYSRVPKEVSYTQDLQPDDSNHDLGVPKCGLWKGGDYNSLSLSLSGGGTRLSPKVIGKP